MHSGFNSSLAFLQYPITGMCNLPLHQASLFLLFGTRMLCAPLVAAVCLFPLSCLSIISEVIFSVLYWFLYHTLFVVYTPRNCRHVDGMMSVYEYICLILVAIQTAQRPTRYTRDQLLPLRASATLLNHDQRLRITQLGLRRRGARAGNHTRHSRQAAASNVMSSTCSTSTAGESR